MTGSLSWPLEVICIVVRLATTGRVYWAGVIRCGLIHSGMATSAAANTARVRPMAGMVRRTSRPAVTPIMKASAAAPMGTMPRVPNTIGSNLDSWLVPTGNPPARSIGPAHQDSSSPAIPAKSIAAPPPMAILTSSHLVRVTDWFHVSRCVPASSSLCDHRGAPERADDQGRQVHDGAAGEVKHRVAAGLHLGEERRRAGAVLGGQVAEAGFGQRERQREEQQRASGDEKLQAGLPPGEPGHDAASR